VTRLRVAVVLWAAVVVMAGPASAADDVVARAMRLYEARHYEDAARTLQAALPSLDASKRPAAHLALGMIYLGSAELHGELYRVGTTIQLDYLKKLAGASGGSRFVNLYLGKLLLDSGNCEEATRYLTRFTAQAALEPRDRAIGRAYLGLCQALRNDTSTARAAWSDIDATDPEVQATLAAVYSRAGIADRNPVAMAQGALAKARQARSTRMRDHALAVYARAGLIDKGLELLRPAELKAASRTEVLGRSKTLNFYDVALLRDLATLYRKASVAHLEQAAGDSRLKATASYYLAAAHADAGNPELSLRATAAFLAVPDAPAPYRIRARARHAANDYALGRRSEAMAQWDELAKAADAHGLAAALDQCARVKAECAAMESRAQVLSEAARGRDGAPLNIALGRYYLSKQDHARAVSHLEAGRDKSNKNRIEANDPVMLVNLAEVYYRRKQFSESLEIYFEMSKQFPAVRPLQEAMQGIYSIEHKSAGDVKIF
jgi:tetratricopeptide (TPR) repeat protein